MSVLLQDLIVSGVALGAVTAIGFRARAMFASKPSGTPCGSCTKCPATTTAFPQATLNASPNPQSGIIRLTVIPGGRR